VRELIAETRKKSDTDTPHMLHGDAANVAIGEIMERWQMGMSVAPGSYIENVHVKNAQGELVGIRMYLVQGEPRPLGPIRTEVLDDE